VPGGLLRVVLEACNVDVMLWPLVAGVVASSAVGGDEIRLDRQDCLCAYAASCIGLVWLLDCLISLASWSFQAYDLWNSSIRAQQTLLT
jgi:hypothetical protein